MSDVREEIPKLRGSVTVERMARKLSSYFYRGGYDMLTQEQREQCLRAANMVLIEVPKVIEDERDQPDSTFSHSRC